MIRWDVAPTAAGAAQAAAEVIAAAARSAIAERGTFTLAVSGGSTPGVMLCDLQRLEVPWPSVTIYQVDERIAPRGSPVRNLTALAAVAPAGAALRAMPVDDPDLGAAAAVYARLLPERLDLIHLGIGEDGHTASLVPGDSLLDVRDRDVAVTAPYRGHARMTLTFPVLDRARQVLWLAVGSDKRGPLASLRDGDERIPASHVRAERQVVVCDSAAFPG